MAAETDPGLFKWAAAGLVTAITGIFAWTGKRQIQRIDNIERRVDDRVTRAELKEHVDTLNQSLRDGFKQNRDDIRYIRERVDKLSDK